MSTVSSQQEFSEQLAEFQNSSDKDIMLIVSILLNSVLFAYIDMALLCVSSLLNMIYAFFFNQSIIPCWTCPQTGLIFSYNKKAMLVVGTVYVVMIYNEHIARLWL